MEPLKEMFNKKFYQEFAKEFSKVDKNFNPEKFYKDVIFNLDSLSLNERLRNTSIILKKYLPDNFKKSVDILTKAAPNLRNGYTSLVLPDYVGIYGLEDFDTSLQALKYFTQFGSS